MKRSKKAFAVLGLTATVMAATATAAWARSGNGSETIQNPYVKFDGNIYWYPNGVNNGAMEVYGNLYNSAGGNYAKIQGQVEGYSYTTLWTTDGSTNAFYGNYNVWDPQSTESDTGTVNVCHVNNWSADDCSSEYNTRN